MKNKKLQKYRRSFLGTVVVIITFLLLFGCNRDKNTDNNENESAITTMEVTTSCTTSTTTSTTSNLTTSSTTTSTTTATTELTMTTESSTMTVWVNTVQIEPIYVAPQTETVQPITEYTSNELPITDYERTLLRNVVANEYGSDWVSVQEKAKVVATVMNRVNSPSYPNSIEGVLTQPYQFSGYYATDYEWNTVTDSVREAVDYYFDHSDEFGSYTSFWGDGTYNHFY